MIKQFWLKLLHEMDKLIESETFYLWYFLHKLFDMGMLTSQQHFGLHPELTNNWLMCFCFNWYALSWKRAIYREKNKNISSSIDNNQSGQAIDQQTNHGGFMFLIVRESTALTLEANFMMINRIKKTCVWFRHWFRYRLCSINKGYILTMYF